MNWTKMIEGGDVSYYGDDLEGMVGTSMGENIIAIRSL